MMLRVRSVRALRDEHEPGEVALHPICCRCTCPPERRLCALLRESEEDSSGRDRRAIARGKPIYLEGMQLDAVFVVCRGLGATTRTTNDGRVHVYDYHGPGEVLGLDALTRRPTDHAVVMVRRSQILRIEARRIRDGWNDSSELANHMLDLLGELLRRSHDRALQISDRRGMRRLSSFLRDLHEIIGQGPETCLSCSELADLTGLSLSEIDRVASTLRDLGAVGWHRRSLRAVDCTGIESLLRSGDEVENHDLDQLESQIAPASTCDVLGTVRRAARPKSRSGADAVSRQGPMPSQERSPNDKRPERSPRSHVETGPRGG